MLVGLQDYFDHLFTPGRIILVILVALASHGLVYLIRRASVWLMAIRYGNHSSKAHTLIGLASSILVFLIYFGALGFILNEFGVPVRAYLASTSILALAIGFGSQGMVQDVVTGLTIIFTDMFHVGDLVEISGQSGRVEKVGMRFTVLINSMGARVLIPNRSIANVIYYPKGYLRAIIDLTLPSNPTVVEKMTRIAESQIKGFAEQFPGILIAPPSIEGRFKTAADKDFMRIKFRIWPGRGGPIETTFKQELALALKEAHEDFQEWMVSIQYEVEKKGRLERRRSTI